MHTPLRILLADDHTMFRQGVKLGLASFSDVEVVGEARDGIEAVALARETMPDIILMDICMPRLSGLQATELIKREMPHVKIVMLTVSDEEQDLYEAIRSGAQGYLLKDLEPRDLVQALELVAKGEVLLSGSVAGKILREFRLRGTSADREMEIGDPLSARELQGLELVAEGLSNLQIAEALVLSENTVKNHLSNILSKLHLRNRIQLAAYAIRHGLARDSQ